MIGCDSPTVRNIVCNFTKLFRSRGGREAALNHLREDDEAIVFRKYGEVVYGDIFEMSDEGGVKGVYI